MKAPAPADIDPYARGFLHAPWEAFRRLHQAGPVLWHAGLHVWIVAGHAAAHEALADAAAFPVMDTRANLAGLAARARRAFPTLDAVLAFVPFVLNPPATKWMEGVPLCDEDKAKILSGNAKRLLRM